MGAVTRLVFFTTLLFFFDVCRSASLRNGTADDGELIYLGTVNIPAVQYKILHKSVSYKGNEIIKAVEVIDLADTNAVATVKSGGVGYTFIKIKLESERGEPLNFQLKVYV